MKKILAAALALLLHGALAAQHHALRIADTAEYVVDSYLTMLNADGLPKDSLLVIETLVTVHGSADTTLMRRWYQHPGMFRIEVEHNDYLQFAIYSNGAGRYRHFDPHGSTWTDITAEQFAHHLTGYDWRGPLYDWRGKGATLAWNGTTTLKGQPLQVVQVKGPEMFDRYYMFDPANKLLTLIIETDSDTASYRRVNPNRIDWKTIHEYTPVGPTLIPTLESFMRGGHITFLRSTVRLAPRDERLFNND